MGEGERLDYDRAIVRDETTPGGGRVEGRGAASAAPLTLHVVAGLGVGGAERMLAALVTASRANAPRQVVVDLLANGALAPEIRAADVPVYEIGIRSPMGVPRGIAALARLIRRLRPDVVQSWMYYGDLLALWALERSGRRAETRLYWGVRCSDMDQSRYGPVLRWTIAACARRAGRPDAVVANSYAGRDSHRALGYRPRAFPVIPNGIDTSRFRPDAEARAAVRAELGVAEDTVLALHVARVDPMKDHGALCALAGRLPGTTFAAVGKGTEALVGPPNLLLLGIRRDMPRLYAAADIVLSTSAFGEGFPNVIAEGMAAGLPAVATAVGDAEAIVGPAGRVVAPRDGDALAAATAALAGDARLRRDLGLAARARIKELFSLDRCVAMFDALHREGRLPDDTPPASAAVPRAEPGRDGTPRPI